MLLKGFLIIWSLQAHAATLEGLDIFCAFMKGSKWAVQEVKSAQAGGLVIAGAQVGHIAHLGGALVGVLLVLALSRIPDVKADR